jgi:predicted PurR-regulated permease PerM
MRSVAERAKEEEPAAVLPSRAAQLEAETPDTPPEPVVVRMPVGVRGSSLRILVVLGATLMAQYAQALLIPIVIGILISYSLAPLVSGLERLRIRRALGAGLAVLVFVGTVGVGVSTLSDQAMQTVSSVPEVAKRIRERVRLHRRQPEGTFQMMQRAATEIDKAAQEATTEPAAATQAKTPGVTKVEVVEPPFKVSDYLWSGGVSLAGFLGQFVLVMFLVYFFLVTGDLYKRKLVKIAGPTLTHKKITVQILDEINLQIGSFIRVQVFTSFVVAVATAIALWGFGVNQFVVWGLLAGLFNSIPYVGPVLVTGGLGIVTFLQFDDLLKTAYVCSVAFAITSLEGFLLTPHLMSRTARMNPVAIFVGLLFWSWLWGVWGTVLAVPMLMMLKAICDHVEDLQSVGEMLGE